MKELSKRDLETASQAAFALIVIPFFLGLGAATPFFTWEVPFLPFASISIAALSFVSGVYFLPKAWMVDRLLRARRLQISQNQRDISTAPSSKHPNLWVEVFLGLLTGAAASVLLFADKVPDFPGSSYLGGLVVGGFVFVIGVRTKSVLKRWGALPNQPLQRTRS